jgi:DNA-directed RNA polymerase subunit F
MEVVNTRAALLSNFEVLSLLRGLEADHLSRTKTAFRVKKEEEASAAPSSSFTIPGNISHLEASENLRTVQVEAISYLSANYLPNISQKEEGITKLVKDLAPYGLTKAEKLQIVNLAPIRPVELYVIVEELEDRLGEDRIEEILGHVKESLTQSHSDTINSHSINGAPSVQQGSLIVEQDHWDLDADAPYEEDMYDDTGEGAGVEGDLDMEED